MDARTFIGGFIDAHEGGLSIDPKDNGNWFDISRWRAGKPQARGIGVLVGSNYGVTGATLASFLGNPTMVSADRIKAVTRDEAVTIGVSMYYAGPRIDLLPWNHVTAAVIDVAWMSGPATAIKLLQRIVGAGDDGKITPGGETVTKVKAYLALRGEEAMAAAYEAAREALYAQIASNEGPNDPDRKYLNGWIARARSFLSKTVWWTKFAA